MTPEQINLIPILTVVLSLVFTVVQTFICIMEMSCRPGSIDPVDVWNLGLGVAKITLLVTGLAVLSQILSLPSP